MDRIRRRLIAGSAAGAVALALARSPASAQAPPRPKRVVRLAVVTQLPSDEQVAAVRKRRSAAWAKQGLIEGRDIVEDLVYVLQLEWDEKARSEFDARAREVVASRPDVIITLGAAHTLRMKGLAGATPIVFAMSTDPVRFGIVESLRRPGGNATGVLMSDPTFKRVEVAKALVPKAQRVALLFPPGGSPDGEWPADEGFWPELQSGASQLGIRVVAVDPSPDRSIDAIAQELRNSRAEAFVVYHGPWVRDVTAETLFQVQLRSRVPGVLQLHHVKAGGGCVTLEQDGNEGPLLQFAIAAKVIRGERPATIPVHVTTRVRLTVNLGVARALGVTVPPALLLRADEVLEGPVLGQSR